MKSESNSNSLFHSLVFVVFVAMVGWWARLSGHPDTSHMPGVIVPAAPEVKAAVTPPPPPAEVTQPTAAPTAAPENSTGTEWK
ncbi:MAG: hypothetical protein JST16_11810 [Bdellovibrionales bacterium]|nr:hypothetical protein [Bdellovibrionales bacterium]